jgi:hypothetical protein
MVCDHCGERLIEIELCEGQAASLALRDLAPWQTVVTELADDAT